MIPNHKGFLEAIQGKKKVCVRFYSKADNGVLDRVCAPMDYGPGADSKDGLNRYWLWDYASKTGSFELSLVPQQIVDLQVLGELFDPALLDARPWQWSIPRDWPMGGPTQPATVTRAVAGTEQKPEARPANKA